MKMPKPYREMTAEELNEVIKSLEADVIKTAKLYDYYRDNLMSAVKVRNAWKARKG